MPPIVEKQVTQVKEFWRGLEKPQKNRIYITTGMVVVAVALLIFIVTKPNRMTLFSGSVNDQAQVGEMSTLLTEAGIWNRLEDGGTSIAIDTKNNDQSQVLLAQAGYPKDGMAFEDAMSMIGLTTTDAEKDRIWKAQTTADIEKKIKMLDNIANATVQLAIPEQSIFLTEANREPPRPTSTVTIWPRDGKNPLPTQIDGIKQIVIGSVEGMTTDDIRVIDNMGFPLEGTVDDPLSQIPNQEDLRTSRTKELENKIYRLIGLSKYDSFDNFTVVASPYLDFSTQEYTDKQIRTPSGFDAGSGALLEQHNQREEAENYATGGVPAMDTNPGETTPVYPLQGNDGTGTYNRTDNQTAYGYDERVESGVNATGTLDPARSHLSIVLGYGIDIPDDTNLTDEFMQAIATSASHATSVPVENISVTKMRLVPPVDPIIPLTERIQGLIAEYGVLLLLLFLIITLILSLFMRGKKKEDEEVGSLQLQIAEGIIEPEDEKQQYKDIVMDEKSEIREQLEKLIKQKPEAVASLLRNWITEDWE